MKTPCITLALVAASTLFVPASDEEGFQPLFNGTDTTGRHLRHSEGHNSWSVENGTLKNTVGEGQHGTDLVTANTFLRREYRTDWTL